MIRKIHVRTLYLGATALLVAGLVSAPVELGPQGIALNVASAAHDAPDGNNGHGNNISPITGEKVDDATNPNYTRDNTNDGNSGLGNDKNGNNGNKGDKGDRKGK